MQILLIDDNEKLCLLYQALLMRGGHDTRFETNPTKALDIIRETKPDLVLLDIMMEPVSGWDVLEKIRNDEEYAELPVVILTGKVLTVGESLKFGLMIEGFVMKPLERTMLLAAIDDVKEVMDESKERYSRALSSGMSPEKADACRKSEKKRMILQFLRENLSKQELLLKKESENYSDIMSSLDELRAMIAQEYQKSLELSENCP